VRRTFLISLQECILLGPIWSTIANKSTSINSNTLSQNINETFESYRILIKFIRTSLKNNNNDTSALKVPFISPKLRVITLSEFKLTQQETEILVRSLVESPFIRLNKLNFSCNRDIGKSQLFFEFLGKNKTIEKLFR
jgi:hypothetical protein